MNYKKKINTHYNQLIAKHGYSKSGIGWKSDKLNMRFSKFSNHINFENCTILDYGAGLGHFQHYLNKEKINFKKYYYYDINHFLKEYFTKNYSSKKIRILDSYPSKKFDIIIMNGVHNYNYSSNNKIIRQDIKNLFKISKKCFGFSFLNNDVDYKEKNLFYHDENKLVNFVKRFSRNIIIDKTFGRFETFILMYK